MLMDGAGGRADPVVSDLEWRSFCCSPVHAAEAVAHSAPHDVAHNLPAASAGPGARVRSASRCGGLAGLRGPGGAALAMLGGSGPAGTRAAGAPEQSSEQEGMVGVEGAIDGTDRAGGGLDGTGPAGRPDRTPRSRLTGARAEVPPVPGQPTAATRARTELCADTLTMHQVPSRPSTSTAPPAGGAPCEPGPSSPSPGPSPPAREGRRRRRRPGARAAAPCSSASARRGQPQAAAALQRSPASCASTPRRRRASRSGRRP